MEKIYKSTVAREAYHHIFHKSEKQELFLTLKNGNLSFQEPHTGFPLPGF